MRRPKRELSPFRHVTPPPRFGGEGAQLARAVVVLLKAAAPALSALTPRDKSPLP